MTWQRTPRFSILADGHGCCGSPSCGCQSSAAVDRSWLFVTALLRCKSTGSVECKGYWRSRARKDSSAKMMGLSGPIAFVNTIATGFPKALNFAFGDFLLCRLLYISDIRATLSGYWAWLVVLFPFSIQYLGSGEIVRYWPKRTCEDRRFNL